MAWSTPATWVAGIPTVANFNARIRDQFNALGDPWTAYTPTWTAVTTNPVLNNGTLTGKYREIGKTIDYRIELTIGSTTTLGSGNYRFTFPVTARAATGFAPLGRALCFDTSLTARAYRNVGYNTTTTLLLSDDSGTQVSNTVPFTWATGDVLVIQGQYEAA